MIVLPEPFIDDDLCLFGGVEPLSIKDFMAERSIEAFVVSILPCAARQASEAPPRGVSRGRPGLV